MIPTYARRTNAQGCIDPHPVCWRSVESLAKWLAELIDRDGPSSVAVYSRSGACIDEWDRTEFEDFGTFCDAVESGIYEAMIDRINPYTKDSEALRVLLNLRYDAVPGVRPSPKWERTEDWTIGVLTIFEDGHYENPEQEPLPLAGAEYRRKCDAYAVGF